MEDSLRALKRAGVCSFNLTLCTIRDKPPTTTSVKVVGREGVRERERVRERYRRAR